MHVLVLLFTLLLPVIASSSNQTLNDDDALHQVVAGDGSKAYASYPSSPPSPCFLPQQIGTGPYRIPRWFFNPSRSRCELFYWSGCCANQNNFQNHEACQQLCEQEAIGSGSDGFGSPPPLPVVGQYKRPWGKTIFVPFEMTLTVKPPPPPPPRFVLAASDPCNLELDSGYPHPTADHSPPMKRFFFNSETQLCQEFSFKGVGGNSNNFYDLDQCRRQCRESPTPCAYAPPSSSSSSQLIQCSPSQSSVCGGQQFCHVGASPSTTICCPKPPIQMDRCAQPLNIGVGSAQLQRYYYNPPSGQCQQYVYRGLQGNENNFLTLIECESMCQVNPCARGVPYKSGSMGQTVYCSSNNQAVCPAGYFCHLGADERNSVCCQALGGDPCGQAPDRGQGTSQLPRWYWDQSRQCCQPFLYSGEKGSQNNFLTKQDCERFCMVEVNPCRLPIQPPLTQCLPGPQACGGRMDLWCHVGATQQTTVCCPVEAINRCLQPMERGVGNAILERWGFNAQMLQCQPYTYTGLKGTQNSFLTREECEYNCLPNPCPTGRPSLTSDGRPLTCSVSSNLNTCPPDHWCHLGVDSSTTVCCPDASMNACQLPMSSGEGLANLERFYYDSPTKTCRPFLYKGIKGNQNNFLSIQACQLACQPFDNPCIGQPATSSHSPNGSPIFCSATNKDTCPVNFWCHLGAEPSSTVCCPGATNPCSVPLAPGTGNSGLARWYYNADDRECVAFQYNGRRGNQNNFVSQAECERTCPQQLCLLSIDRGACSGRQTRYAFNRQTGQCVPFEYTGCGGNLNNFLTMADCVATCGNVNF